MKRQRTTRFAGEFKCVICKTWFVAHRSHAKTCGSSCRSALCRRRKRDDQGGKKRV